MTPRRAQVLIGLGTAVAVLLVVLIVVLVMGNGGDTALPALPATTSSTVLETTAGASTATTEATTTSASTTTTSTPTTTSTSTTTTTAAVACPGPGAGVLPVGASIAVDVWGDFDGDGAADRFLVYNDSGGTYWARVELAYGYAAVAPDPQPGPGVINAKAVNLGGGADLAIAESLASPSSRLATFYALYGCDLAAAIRDGTEIAQFPLRGSGMELAGITCRADGIDVTGARNTGGSEWEVTTIFYQWVAGIGEFQGSLGAAAILTSPGDDAAIQSHADWNC
jgi:hypothetical protein